MSYIYFLTGQGLNNFAPLVLAPIIIASLGLYAWGEFSLFLLATTFASAFYTGKIQSVHSDAVRISKKNYLKNKDAQIITGVTTKLLVNNTPLIGALLLTYGLSSYLGCGEKNGLILLGLANGISQSILASYRLSHLVVKDYVTFAYYALISFCCKVIGVWIALHLYENIELSVIIYFLVNALEIIIRNILMKRKEYSKITGVISARSWRLILPLLFYSQSIIIDRIIIERLMTVEEFGIYNLLMMIVGASVFAISPINQQLIMSRDIIGDLKKYSTNITFAYSTMIVICYFFYEYIDYSAEYLTAEHLKYIILGIFISLFQILTGLHMVRHQVNQNIKFYWRLGLLGFAINLIVMPYLVHSYDIEGAIWGMIICSVVLLAFVVLGSHDKNQRTEKC